MNWEFLNNFFGVGSFVISLVVAFFGFRKSKAEVNNLDANTFDRYQEALSKAQKNYDESVASFKKEVAELNKKIDRLEKSNNDLNIHNRALTKQLIEEAKLVPITLEEAKRKVGD